VEHHFSKPLLDASESAKNTFFCDVTKVENFDKKCLTLSKGNQKSLFKLRLIKIPSERVNPRKSRAILISNSAVGMMLPSLFLGTEEIPWYDAVTDLELVIDGRLRFDRQVTKECSRVYATHCTDCIC
jgi:hypothetical protein